MYSQCLVNKKQKSEGKQDIPVKNCKSFRRQLHTTFFKTACPKMLSMPFMSSAYFPHATMFKV